MEWKFLKPPLFIYLGMAIDSGGDVSDRMTIKGNFFVRTNHVGEGCSGVTQNPACYWSSSLPSTYKQHSIRRKTMNETFMSGE